MSMLLDVLRATLRHVNRAVAVQAAVGIIFVASGCALTDVPTRAMSDLSEAKTRKEISRLAENDPFPSASDVGR